MNLYSKVENKVIFGLIETSWFEVMNGVKQGCILSPTLFTTAMTDLVAMLNKEKLGVNCLNLLIPALLYADDIVLMAENDEQLSKMLAVSATFARKWGLKFNCVKSKVMVIGQKTNPGKLWALGDISIEETNCYKYLGVLFSKNLSDVAHVEKLLVPKVKKLRGYITSILARHFNVNRISFGNTLYYKVAVPSILHGCCVWIGSKVTSKKYMRSMQYDLARAILQIRATPAYIATIGDLC